MDDSAITLAGFNNAGSIVITVTKVSKIQMNVSLY